MHYVVRRKSDSRYLVYGKNSFGDKFVANRNAATVFNNREDVREALSYTRQHLTPTDRVRVYKLNIVTANTEPVKV